MSEELLEVEDELDEPPYVEFDISVSPADPTLELLANQIERDDIIVPFYQRKFVWKIEQASRLVESFLMGLPVPQVFLYVNAEDQLEVIDGQQRLMSVKYFFEGYFGEEDNKGRRQVFKLKGLSERSEYNGLTFEELPARDQRKLRHSTLRAIHIKQLKPTGGNESVFHIFERLNTGGTQLKPQEIRNAVYRGPIVTWLWKLNEDPNWQAILGLKKPDKNQKDVELVLRLFALFQEWPEYEKPMLSYLNRRMHEKRELPGEKHEIFAQRFTSTVNVVNANLERPFRPKSVVNSAVLEAVMLALLEDESITAEQLNKRYPKLLLDEQFRAAITGATTDTLVLRGRIERAKHILGDAT